MITKHRQVACLLWVALLGTMAAQNTAPVPTPAPAAPQTETGTVAMAEPAQPTISPDTRPVTGAQQLTIGSLDQPSFLVPKLHFNELVDTNPAVSGTSSDPSALSSITGQLNLQKRSRTSELTANYQGGGSFYATRPESTALNQRNSTFHGLGISERMLLGRWSVLMSDEVNYSSAGAFGTSGASGVSLGSITLGGTSLAGLNSAFLPAQNVLAQTGSRVSNTTALEVDYQFSPRDALTVVGNYGFVRFPDGDLLNSDQKGVTVGYNRTLNRHDTIGLSYGFTTFGYSNLDSELRDHTVQIVYGRRVTGRLSLRVAGGATAIQPVGLGSSGLNTGWNADAGLHYALRKTDLSASYTRSVNAGSGVVQGATSDSVHGDVSHQLSRRWFTTASIGYSRNIPLALASEQFTTLFVGCSVRRNLGRYTGIDINYSFQRQNGAVPCLGCGNESLRHTVGIGFDWGFRPIRLQ